MPSPWLSSYRSPRPSAVNIPDMVLCMVSIMVRMLCMVSIIGGNCVSDLRHDHV